VEGLKAAIALLLLALMFPAALAQQESYKVVLKGEPGDCIAALAGEGTYRAYSSVTVEARPTPNCKFLKWVVVKGLRFNETSANPMSFNIEGDVELIAVFERLYEKPGGQPIERAIVYISTNVTGKQEPEPIITMPGSELKYSFEKELYLGEAKYVFLYAEADGQRYDTPTIRVRVPESGKLSIKAYYYTYLRFLNEYYPKDQFVKVEIEPVREVSDGVRLRAVGYKVANKTFPIDQPVPRQLAKLVEPNYVKEYRLRVYSDGAPATVEVNGARYYANPVAEAWVKEGSQVTVTAPEKLERHRLERVDAGKLAVMGGIIMGPLTSPTLVTLVYKPIPNAFLLDIPFAGPFLLQVADLGTAVTGLEGVTGFVAGLLIVASPAAAVSAAALLRPGTRRIRTTVKAVKRATVDPEVAAVSAAVTASLPSRKAGYLDQALRASGKLQIHPLLRSLAQEVTFSRERPPTHTEELEKVEEEGDVITLRQEAEEALGNLRSGGKAKLTPEHIASIDCDIDTYDLLRNAVEEGRLEVGEGLGYLGYEMEGRRIAKAVRSGNLVVVVRSPDLRLGELVAAEACREAKLPFKKAGTPKDADVKKATAELKKQAGGAKALIHIVEDEAVERLVAKTAPLMGIVQVIVSRDPALQPAAEIPEPTKERYTSMAAAYAASKDLLGRLTHEHIDYIGEIAYSFRGLASIEEAISRLLAEKKTDPSEVLREVFRDEAVKTFTPEELELITSYETVEDLRSGYIAYVRQVRPGTRPEAEWAKMYERLRRLGVVA
jgi:hypothetical protein